MEFNRAASNWFAAKSCGVSILMGDPVGADNKPAYKLSASGGNAAAAATNDDGDNGELRFNSSWFMFAKMFTKSMEEKKRFKMDMNNGMVIGKFIIKNRIIFSDKHKVQTMSTLWENSLN